MNWGYMTWYYEYGVSPYDVPVYDGGGGSGGNIDPPKSEWKHMPAALERVLELLDKKPSCMQLFGTEETRRAGFDPRSVAKSIFSQQSHMFGQTAFAPLSSGVDAITLPSPVSIGIGPFGVPIFGLKVSVIINSSSKSDWNSGDSSSRAITLFHELGHAYMWLAGSGGSKIKWDPLGIGSSGNDQTVINNCLK